ncbi:hypothetical protein BGZ83_004519 [Gryganskiella cystojenkinii]|nr:hypothetical protein BGZ83_004519 [Gryganskiella cystojenkinii]
MRIEIKVSYREDGRKLDRVFEFPPETTCRQAVEQVCSAFALHSDWTLAMYSRKHGGWAHDNTRLVDITFKGHKTLELRRKTSSYFEVLPSSNLEPSKTSLRDSTTILRGPTSPIDHHRLFNFFRTSDDPPHPLHPQQEQPHSLISKLQSGSIYLSVILLNSDGKILLSHSGLPPTILVSTVDRGNYYNFDTDSADFAWMFKTTLDWASEKAIPETTSSSASFVDRPSTDGGGSGGRQRRFSSDITATLLGASSETEIATPAPVTDPRTITTALLSPPPGPRKSFSSNRVSSPNHLCPNKSPVSGNSSSISVDRSSVLSDITGSSITAGRPSGASSTTAVAAGKHSFQYKDRQNDYRRENRLRREYVAAVERLQLKLGIPPIDLLHDRVMDLPQVGAKSIMAIQYVRDHQRDQVAQDQVQTGSFRWRHIESISNSVYTRREQLWSELVSYYDNTRVSRPTSGLYVGLYYTESTMAGLQILVPKNRRTFVPLVKVRENGDLTPEEWTWMQSTAAMDLNQLAKNCAVSKEDPMHHLKVEFAHSTAKLSRLTQLKWNPSDMYTVDTMRVVVQDDETLAAAETEPFVETTALNSGYGWGQSLAAMSQDPIWIDYINPKDGSIRRVPGHQEDHTTGAVPRRRLNSFRVIMFIKPTRHATQPQEHFNRQLFELCPFNLFDALHHSVFNASMYHQLRKTMQQVTNEIGDLELEIELDLEQDIQRSRRASLSNGSNNNNAKTSNGKVGLETSDGSDIIGSLLIDDLNIKNVPENNGPSAYRQSVDRPRPKSCYFGDATIQDLISGANMMRRSDSIGSTHSLLEAIERSAMGVSPVLSASSTQSSYSADTFATVPPIPDSRTSHEGNEAMHTPLDSSPSSGSSSMASNSSSSSTNGESYSYRNKPEAILPFDRHRFTPDHDRVRSRSGPRLCLDEFDPTNAVTGLPGTSGFRPTFSGSCTSIQSLVEVNDALIHHSRQPSPRSHPIAASNNNGNGGQQGPSVNFRLDNRPLPPLPHQTTQHRRSQSQLQQAAAEWLATSSSSSTPPPPPSLNRSGCGLSRSRTTTHSSNSSVSFRNRYIASLHGTNNESSHTLRHKSSLMSALNSYAPPCPHHPGNGITSAGMSTPQQNGGVCSCNQQLQQQRSNHPSSPELERLAQQQQAFQEQWRLISWTRQLNEWDHARMLKGQEDLFGFGLNFGNGSGGNVSTRTNVGSPLLSSSTPVRGGAVGGGGIAVSVPKTIRPLGLSDDIPLRTAPLHFK